MIVHSLASYVDPDLPMKDAVRWTAAQSRERLPDGSYSAAMYDFVVGQHAAGRTWEEARDALYERYQVRQEMVAPVVVKPDVDSNMAARVAAWAAAHGGSH